MQDPLSSREHFDLRTVDLKIEDVAFGGKGVGRENGKAVFVPFTIDSEMISAQITHEKKQFAEAELVDLQERSPHRVNPECPYFGRCGGCSYQHINYEYQLAIKWRQVRDVLQRIGKLKDIPMRPIIPSPISYAYRNRITVHAQDGVIGFFRRDSHRLIDIERCPISLDQVNQALAELRTRAPRDGHYTLRAQSGPRVFSQANDAVANALRDLIARLIPGDQELLIDAYCGAGFFAKRLLEKFERIIGIDWDRFAIEAAMENATAKENYIVGDVDVELRRVLQIDGVEAAVSAAKSGGIAGGTPATTVIADPPATGLTAKTRRAIADLAPGTFIYVSCNPPTLARDLAELQQSFTIDSVTPLDMFPQTAEIEVVVHLELRREVAKSR
ncbi:MAG TPA: TRAM domain-containing protein [Chthoniobacterales bacterium]|nr:TRAM domain-containing protein [Chthoniobacterales bacterium]